MRRATKAFRFMSFTFRFLRRAMGGWRFVPRPKVSTDSPLAPRGKIDLAPIFRAIEDDLRSQYLIGFYVAEKAHDGKLHKLSLGLPDGLEYQIGDRGYENTHKFV